MLGVGLGLTAVAAAAMQSTVEAQAPAIKDRNGNDIKVGYLVNVPCLITAITPSLNPAITSVTVQTLPNIGVDYDEGLSLIVYASQVLKP